METSFTYASREAGYFSTDEKKWINKILRLKEKFPDAVEILAEPDNNDGCLYCKIPTEWFRLQPKKTCNMTDEQRAELVARLHPGLQDTQANLD